MQLFKEAGVPDGVFNTVNGAGGEIVNELIDHTDVQAVTFVGSTPIARIVSNRCKGINKRCIALGGAKNHLVALGDCDFSGTVKDVLTPLFSVLEPLQDSNSIEEDTKRILGTYPQRLEP